MTLSTKSGRQRETSRKGKRRCAWVWSLAATWVSAVASAITPATLTDTQLRDTSVRLVSINDAVVSLYDASGVLRQQRTRDIVRLRFASKEAPADDPNDTKASDWTLTLTDGQRWAGFPAESYGPSDNETLRWTHPTLGTVAVSLERVQRIERQTPPTNTIERRDWAADSQAQPADDTATLRNGDTLTGFVAALDDQALTLETDNGDVPLTWNNLAEIRLANPPQRGFAQTDVLALRDGSRIHLRAVDLDETTIQATPTLLAETLGIPEQSAVDDQARRTLPLADAALLDFAASGHRLIDLTTLSPEVRGGDAFGLSFPPQLVANPRNPNATRAWVHAPATLTFNLPAGTTASHFVGRATLDLPSRLTPDAVALADASFSVADHAGERFTRPLRSDVPLPFRVSLQGHRIELRVLPGPHGPALDRVRLDQLRLLLKLDGS